MDHRAFEAIVASAMLAPSAHNTQPVRWSLVGDTISISVDPARRLPIGDPDDRDLNIAVGAAAEGTVLALANNGIGAVVEWCGHTDGQVAKIVQQGPLRPEDVRLANNVQDRITYRHGFEPASIGDWQDENWTQVVDRTDIHWIATQIDVASARIMGNPAFRQELLHWMRLKPAAPGFAYDGLNSDALAMDAFTARCAGAVLGTKVYDVCAKLGLGPAISGERKRSSEASAIALFHWPEGGSMRDAGRAFYRFWLEATARGLVGWPAAALADDPATAQALHRRFDVPKGRVLVNALRLGKPKGPIASRTRLPVSQVII